MPSSPDLSLAVCFCLFFSWVACISSVVATPAEPAINSNFPDPCLVRDKDGRFYAFATQNKNINVQVASSPDFITWQLHESADALPQVPAWAKDAPLAEVWAPDVNALPSGRGWIMYFGAVSKAAPRKHCIGAATSENLTGPYTPQAKPLVCDLHRGGNIDPNLFHDPVNDLYYLVYKVDGNSIGHGGRCGNTVAPVASTPVYAQQMSAEDLTTPVGQPIFLIDNLAHGGFKFDGPNTERPSMTYRNGTYYLLYNAHCFTTLSYRIDYVSCVAGVDTHTGMAGCDWAKLKAKQQSKKAQTLLKTGDQVSGAVLHAPGSIDTSDPSGRIVFHGDTNLSFFDDHPPNHHVHRTRAMYAAFVDYEGKEGGLMVLRLASDTLTLSSSHHKPQKPQKQQ